MSVVRARVVGIVEGSPQVELVMRPHQYAPSRAVAALRVTMSLLIVGALIATLTDTSGLVPERMIDLLGYYTLQANVIALAVWDHPRDRRRTPHIGENAEDT